jgi:DNA-binding transcriptional MerR regulator
MWTIKDLMERFGLSEKQVRIRLAALDPLLDGHCRTGKQNAILVDDYAFKLFERLTQIEKQGIITKDAAKQVATELGKPDEIGSSPQGQAWEGAGQAGGERWAQLLVEALQERVNALEQDKAYLQRQIEQLLEQLQEKDAQLKTLMLPPPKSRRRWWPFGQREAT